MHGRPFLINWANTILLNTSAYGMINGSIAKLAQYYKLPCFVGGGPSDSKVPDIQAGYEFTLSATLSALAGANIVFGSGVLEQGLTMDYAKLIMDAEMIRMIQTATRGVTISDETLAFDVIHEVGSCFQSLKSSSICHRRRDARTTICATQTANGQRLTANGEGGGHPCRSVTGR